MIDRFSCLLFWLLSSREESAKKEQERARRGREKTLAGIAPRSERARARETLCNSQTLFSSSPALPFVSLFCELMGPCRERDNAQPANKDPKLSRCGLEKEERMRERRRESEMGRGGGAAAAALASRERESLFLSISRAFSFLYSLIQRARS